MKRYLFLLVSLTLLAAPFVVFAYEPIIVEATKTTITQPELHRAYFGQLAGDPHVYTINAGNPFKLTIELRVPDRTGAKTDLMVAVVDTKNPTAPLTVLNGTAAKWQKIHDPVSNEDYLQGPNFSATIPEGVYDIHVWSSNNDRMYILMIGNKEPSTIGAYLSKLTGIPHIREVYFNRSASDAWRVPTTYWTIATAVIILVAIIALIILTRRRSKLGYTVPHA